MAKLFRVSIPPHARPNFKNKTRIARRFSSDANGELWVQQIETRIKAIKAGGELASLGAKVNSTSFRLAAWAWWDQVEVKPATRVWYKGYLKRRLVPEFGALQCSQISKAALAAFRAKRRKQVDEDTGQAPGERTIEAEIDVVLRVLRWAKSAGYGVDAQVFELKKPKNKPKAIRRYDPAELDQLRTAAANPKPKKKGSPGRNDPKVLARIARRDTLVVEVLSRVGLRAGELRAMHVSWIRWAERRIVVPHDKSYSPKGGETRSVPVESSLLASLRSWVDDNELTDRVFEPERPGRPAQPGEKDRKPNYRGKGIDLDKLFARLKAAGGGDLTAHDLRHYAISRWVDLMTAGGWSIVDVQKWAGHVSIRTTELYLHQAPDRWRSHSDALDRAAAGSVTGSASSQSPRLFAVK